MEGVLLGLFMLSAAIFTALLEHPGSRFHQVVPDALVRRAIIGLAMGLTAVALIYSPWGRQSGAHMNPATTLTFLRLGKIAAWDAAFYIAAQFLGGIAGVFLSRLMLGAVISHPSVHFVTTVPGPGPGGAATAFVAEAIMACGMMLTVLFATNSPRLAPYTGLLAGGLVFLYISLEAPLSGMSINPARTAASAVPSGIWTGGWIYFSAPLLGMLLAAQIHRSVRHPGPLACPKLCHGAAERCIFCGQVKSPDTAKPRRGER